MRPAMWSLCSRAVARRLLARRAVARRAERRGATAGMRSVDSGGSASSTIGCLRIGCVCIAENLLTLIGGVAREEEGRSTQRAWNIELGPGGFDHGLKLRASARSRFGGFRASEAEVLPAGSARLPMLSLSGSATNDGLAALRPRAWSALGGIRRPRAPERQFRKQAARYRSVR